MKLVIVKKSETEQFSCNLCYYNPDTNCPNDGKCIYAEGYWKSVSKITASDKIVNDISVNPDWFSLDNAY